MEREGTAVAVARSMLSAIKLILNIAAAVNDSYDANRQLVIVDNIEGEIVIDGHYTKSFCAPFGNIIQSIPFRQIIK